jgi:hypothetical protein
MAVAMQQRPRYTISADNSVAYRECSGAMWNTTQKEPIPIDTVLEAIQYRIAGNPAWDASHGELSSKIDLTGIDTQKLFKSVEDVKDQCHRRFPAVTNNNVALPASNSSAILLCSLVMTGANTVATNLGASTGLLPAENTRSLNFKRVQEALHAKAIDVLIDDTSVSNPQDRDAAMDQEIENSLQLFTAYLQRASMVGGVNACMQRFPPPPAAAASH